MDQDLVPPDDISGLTDEQLEPFKTEYDVVSTLYNIGHEVHPLGVSTDLGVVRQTIEEQKPHIVFNLLEEFSGEAVFDQNVVSYLELLRLPYTGCNPRGMMLARDKALSKQILSYHRIAVPDFAVCPKGRAIKRPKRLKFPLIVKSLIEEASLGISRASIVEDDQHLKERVIFIHEVIGTDAIVEEYIEGREFYIGLLGNHRLHVFPVWELLFTKAGIDIPLLATAKVKWDTKYQKKLGVTTRQADDLPAETIRQMKKLSKRIFRYLGMCGYARMDLRMTPEGKIYVLEANPNPQLAYGEDFAESAHAAGVSYEELIQRIVNLGLRRGLEKTP
jgi:D-alanine-D-alanine ligase